MEISQLTDTTAAVSHPSDSFAGIKNLRSAPRETLYPAAVRSEPAAAKVQRNTRADSAALIVRRDSLFDEMLLRRELFHPHPCDSVRSQEAFSGELFRSDATSWYDVPLVKRYTVLPRIGIAGGFNRLLHYGNTAPLTRIHLGNGLLYLRADHPFYAEDALFTTEYAGIAFPGDGSIRFHPFTDKPICPETTIFWETGVFDQNILAVRFTRAIARRLVLNVFSNYRYFKGMVFSHDGNDIYTFFANITPDTTLLSHKGYNPLVDEYFCGADAVWSGNAAKSFFRVKYGDLTNELPIDRKPAGQYLDHARLQQYPLSFHWALSANPQTRWFLDCEAYALSNPHIWTRPIAQKTAQVADKNRFSSDDISGALRAGMHISRDTLALQFTGHCRQIKAADSLDIRTLQYRPEMLWNHPLSFSFIKGSVLFSAGYDLHESKTETAHSPFWSGRLRAYVGNYQLSIYAEQDNLHYPPAADSLANGSTLNETYFRTGIEIERRLSLAGLLLGYQWCTDIDPEAVNRAWIYATAPYRQPRSVLVIASQLDRWRGIALMSRIMLSDSKPYVKLQSGVSLLVFPKLTRQAIDMRLGMDFWSERDSSGFAGRDDWHRSVLDLNFAMSVHIKSFRLMYKIDNLLNRNFSYIPGYYAPGIFFRWGFSWFIQR